MTRLAEAQSKHVLRGAPEAGVAHGVIALQQQTSGDEEHDCEREFHGEKQAPEAGAAVSSTGGA